MKTEHHQTDAQLQRQVVQLISRELGITNFIRFVQYYEQGCGNYTCDRDAWQTALGA